jgi:N-methylhydantoinase B
MALTIHRTARSFVVKEALDFSTALFLADGQLIAQGTCLPFHLGAMPFAVRAVSTSTAAGSGPATSTSPTIPTTAARTCPTSCW